jgi:hypothetical protein
MMMVRRKPTFTEIRTAMLFMGGLAGATYVTLIDQTDRPTLLILFGAMMGLPLFLRSDEKHPPPVIAVPPPPQILPQPGDASNSPSTPGQSTSTPAGGP